MSLYNFSDQKINPKKICKISSVYSKNVNRKTKYVFMVHLSGNTIESKLYNTKTQALSERNLLKTQME